MAEKLILKPVGEQRGILCTAINKILLNHKLAKAQSFLYSDKVLAVTFALKLFLKGAVLLYALKWLFAKFGIDLLNKPEDKNKDSTNPGL